MGQTILIIEDEDDIRELAMLILSGFGYRVMSAATGEEGLRLLHATAVDLLVLDINLPGIDGWTVCRQLRENVRTADLPVLIFTVRSEKLDQQRSERELADGYLNKPFLREELLNSVQQALCARHAASVL